MEGIVQMPFAFSTHVKKPKHLLHLALDDLKASGHCLARRMHHGCIIVSTPCTPIKKTNGGLDL